jgi:hypothetical protein
MLNRWKVSRLHNFTAVKSWEERLSLTAQIVNDLAKTGLCLANDLT